MATDLPSLDVLCRNAGLDASLADLLAAENVTVALLLRSTLTERREVLRAMNQSFGTLLALNRVLEVVRQERLLAGIEDDVGEEDDDDDRADDEEDEERDKEIDDEEPVMVEDPPSPAPPRAPVPPQLQAAALLLRSAEVHTLRALHSVRTAKRTRSSASRPRVRVGHGTVCRLGRVTRARTADEDAAASALSRARSISTTS
jgi:hypothetical protein